MKKKEQSLVQLLIEVTNSTAYKGCKKASQTESHIKTVPHQTDALFLSEGRIRNNSTNMEKYDLRESCCFYRF